MEKKKTNLKKKLKEKITNIKKYFEVNKKYTHIYVIAAIFIITGIVAGLAYSFALPEEVKEVIIDSDNYNDPGSYRVIKRANWIAPNKAQIEFDFTSVKKPTTENYDIMLILDNSGSMYGDRLNRLKQDTAELITEVLKDKNNNISLVSFNINSEIISDFTNNKVTLLEAIDNFDVVNERTNYYSALVNADKILKNYHHEENRKCIILFLTDGYPNEGNPNEVGQYKYLKNTYPFITVNAIQYEMGNKILDPIKKISDNQFIANIETIGNVLFDATIPKFNYDTVDITDYINEEYFKIEKEQDIKASAGTVKLETEGSKQKVIWEMQNQPIGKTEKLEIIVNLKQNKIDAEETVYMPTNEKEIISAVLENTDNRKESNLTPILRNYYDVKYETNLPEECSIEDIKDEKYKYGVVVSVKSDLPNCGNYKFNSWEIITPSVKKYNDDSFIMPDKEVTLRATWQKLGLAKSMEGTVHKKSQNVPLLTENMIPIYYDKKNNIWRKADATNTNSTHKWYDYNNKMWANAATVISEGNVQTFEIGKKVDIGNEAKKRYTSGNKGIASSSSVATFTFKTGPEAGTLTFSSIVSSEESKDTLTVRLSDGWSETTSGVVYKTYTRELKANTAYTLTATYTKNESGNSNNDQATIYDFTLPDNLQEPLTYIEASTNPWTETDEEIRVNYGVHQYNETTKKYELSSSKSSISSSSVGRYMCADGKSSTCDKIYRITEVTDNRVTEVLAIQRENKTRNDYLNAPLGEGIDINTMNTMWVWIPRYKYTYFTSETSVPEIQIEFEQGTSSTGTIKCADNISANSGKSEICTDTTNGSLIEGKSTYTHPAFTFGNDELTGIWVGKYENSATTLPTAASTELRTVLIKPGASIWTNTALSYFFRSIRNMELKGNAYGFPQTGTSQNAYTGVITGDSNNLDTHLIKNMEWGATTYLSHSKYGTCANGTCETVETNTYDGFITGCGQNMSTRVCYGGATATTTRNGYGIFDMAGGGTEFVMANMASTSNIFSQASAETWSTTNKPLDKYYDKYSYGTDKAEYTRGKMGDAMFEVATGNVVQLPHENRPWATRGGIYNWGNIFKISYATGSAIDSYSSRSVLTILPE